MLLIITLVLVSIIIPPSAASLTTSYSEDFLLDYLKHKDFSLVNIFTPSQDPDRIHANLIKTISYSTGIPAALHRIATRYDAMRPLLTSVGEVLNIALLENQQDVEMISMISGEGSWLRQYSWLILGNPSLLETSDVRPYFAVDNKAMFAVTIPNNSDVTLMDVYQTSRIANYVVRRVGRWFPKSRHFNPHVEDVIMTRTNLTGLHLRCVTLEQQPFVYLRSTADPRIVELHRGHASDVWKILQSIFGFTYTCRKPIDRSWGSIRNGEWTGMVKELVEGTADVAVAPLDNTAERAAAVDFTLGLRNTGYRLIMKRRELMDSTWTTFTHEFTKEAWYATLAFLLLVPPMLTFVTHYSPSEKERISLKDAYVITVGAIAYQGATIMTTSSPGRIVFIVIFLGMLLTYSHYTSALVASLTVASTSQQIETLQDVVKSGLYDLGFMAKISIESEFRDSRTSPFREAWTNFIEPQINNLPTSNLEGIKKASGGAYVHIIDESIFHFEFSSHCDVFALPSLYFSKPSGFAFPKDSPLTKIFDYQILKMRNSGVLSRSWEQQQPPGSLCEASNVVTLNPTQVFTAFLVLMLGAGLSLVLLSLEKLYYHTFDKGRKNNSLDDQPHFGWSVY